MIASSQECKWSKMCVSGIMSASRQECKRSCIMCVSGIMSASRQECKRSYICVLAVSCPHQDRNVSGHTYVC